MRWGLYEKALPRSLTWSERLAAAHSAGYQFVEISIDESDERLARLEWRSKERARLHDALRDAPASIDSMCLSGHRKHALGSASASTRNRALEIMRRAIDFAVEFSLRIVQVAGYDVHYEESTEKTRAFVEAADTPWFQLYPDIGNLSAMGKDVPRELLLGGRHTTSKPRSRP
jgi:L-ribulose-5-phosphate 3-epimerase UlaE